MSEQQKNRDLLISRLVADIHGPHTDAERLPVYQAPRDQYQTGILYPQDSRCSDEEPEGAIEENGSSEPGAVDDQDLVLQQRAWLPSSMGVSLFAESEEENILLEIFVSAGKYLYEPGSKGSQKESVWQREQLEIGPVSLKARNGVPEYKTDIANGLRLFVETRQIGNSSLFTVCLINKFVDNGNFDFQERNEKCFFQTRIAVRPVEGTSIIPRPSVFSNSESTNALNSFLYRNIKEFATGHTCSADWLENAGIATEVSTSWVPVHKVDDVSAKGDPSISKTLGSEGFESFSATVLANGSASEVNRLLSALPKAYEEWLRGQREFAEKNLTGRFGQLASEQLDVASVVRQRIEAGIALLKSNEKIFKAFQLANKAMVLQAEWQGYELDWRPFQIGFFLLSLESLALRNEDRQIMDLLWFPTGGGKTEAYLGLMAFIIFFRRLERGGLEADDGVAVITRYTLRALTTDQFARTSGLVFACELVRRESTTIADEGVPISIGLWIGGTSSPNKIEDAKNALEKNAQPGPDLLRTCPCCKSPLQWGFNIAANEVEARCSGSDCRVADELLPAPVHTVDEQIYKKHPSVVIGTVDKFVQVCRFPTRTSSLFNVGTVFRPPDLIIQDELHLITGPLGSIVGLMELAIEQLCTAQGILPKIIGSTATIQRAEDQVGALFNRTLSQFPPPVLDADNSFFAIRDFGSSGRKYLGLTSAGKTGTYVMQAVAASLLQSVKDQSLENLPIEAIDPFTTLAVYFNSLRILGGARTLLLEDTQKSMGVFAGNRGEEKRELDELQELTSLVTQEELKETLAHLRSAYGNDHHIDILLASVMISVGVDIPRLGLMVVDGQPKTMAEYIQATSRVGRGSIPGLVVTLYNNLKIRDRAHFESFRSWHSALYRSVEASSVTPFSPRARDKAMRALVVAMAMQVTDMNETDVSLTIGRRQKIETDVLPLILSRISAIDPSEVSEAKEELESFLEDWEDRGSLKFLWNDFSDPNESLLISSESAAQRKSAGQGYFGWSAPNSARDVEPSVIVKVRDFLDVDRGDAHGS